LWGGGLAEEGGKEGKKTPRKYEVKGGENGKGKRESKVWKKKGKAGRKKKG